MSITFNSSFTLTDLPDDCLFEILKYISNIRELFVLKKVSKRLRNSVSTYFNYHSIKVVDSELLSTINRPIRLPLHVMFTNCPKLYSLELVTGCWFISEEFNKIKSLPKLITIVICNPAPLIASSLVSLLQKSQNLKNLTLINLLNLRLDEVDWNCIGNQVTYIKIHDINFQNIYHLIELKGHQLTHLDVSFSAFIFRNQLNTILTLIFECCINLRQLKIESLVYGRLNCLFNKMERMEKLELIFPHLEISFPLFEQLIESVPNLRSLNIYFSELPAVDRLLCLCSRFCDNIETIFNYRYDEIITKDGLKIWKKCKKLKSLDFGYYQYQQKQNH